MNGKMRSCVMGLILGQFSSPLPMAQKEPVAYLYNGVRLPKLPEWDREKYPYAVILIYESYLTKKYTAILYLMKDNNVRQAVDTGGGGIYFEYMYYQVGDIQYKVEYKDGEVVTEWGEPTVLTDSLSFDVAKIKWANSDIVLALDTTSGEAGTLYLATSDPVPVYE